MIDTIKELFSINNTPFFIGMIVVLLVIVAAILADIDIEISKIRKLSEQKEDPTTRDS